MSAVAVAPDGAWLATGSRSKVQFRSADGVIRTTITTGTSQVTAHAIPRYGTWLAVVGDGGRSARIWEADGTIRATLTGHTRLVNAVAVSPDSTWLATASDDQTARTWNANGTPRATLTGHTDCVTSVAISADGT